MRQYDGAHSTQTLLLQLTLATMKVDKRIDSMRSDELVLAY